MQTAQRASSYEVQLKTLLDYTSLQYRDEDLRVDLYKADDTLYIMSGFEGPFVSGYTEFTHSDATNIFAQMIDEMSSVAPLSRWYQIPKPTRPT